MAEDGDGGERVGVWAVEAVVVEFGLELDIVGLGGFCCGRVLESCRVRWGAGVALSEFSDTNLNLRMGYERGTPDNRERGRE